MSASGEPGIRQQGKVAAWGTRAQEEGTADTQVPVGHVSPEDTWVFPKRTDTSVWSESSCYFKATHKSIDFLTDSSTPGNGSRPLSGGLSRPPVQMSPQMLPSAFLNI